MRPYGRRRRIERIGRITGDVITEKRKMLCKECFIIELQIVFCFGEYDLIKMKMQIYFC
jgi:hypothetical protein